MKNILLCKKTQNSPLLLAVFLTALITQIACGTFQVIILTPMGETPSETQNTIKETNHPIITNPPTITPEILLATPKSNEPSFSREILFSYEPDAKTTQKVFPSGTKQIFAVWKYSNMRAGLSVRRIWYRNSQVWFYQEEPWDFNRYGTNGTIGDVTIYDFEKGLKEGNYWLRLYIDGTEQTSAQHKLESSFNIISTSSPGSILSPDSKRQLILLEPRTLLIQVEDEKQQVISTSKEIATMMWFPDNRHFLVSFRDRTLQDISGDSSGIRDEFWIIDSETGLRIRITTPDENFHIPSISPDGHYIAAISGTGQYEACKADLSVSVIELDESFTRLDRQNLSDFIGLPGEEYRPFPFNHPAVSLPGKWVDNHRMVTALKFPCSSGKSDGIYLFDLLTQQVEKVP